MIEIKINGQSLDIPLDFSVEKEVETSIFKRELDSRDFTYPSTLPLTDNNNAILGLINHLGIAEKKREYVADMYLNGIYYKQVTLLIQNVSTIEKTIEISIIGTYGTFARIVGSKKLAELALDGDRVVGATSTVREELGEFSYQFPATTSVYFYHYYYPTTADTHVKNVMLGIETADYHFYPAVDIKGNIDYLNDKQVNVLNLMDWDTTEMVNPVRAYYNSAMRDETFNWAQRLFWVPFFKTLYVLRKCFEEHGFVVSGDVFDDPKKQKTSLYNTATFCKYSLKPEPQSPPPGFQVFSRGIVDESNVIHPQDHMPDIGIMDFVNELSKAWNIQYKIDLKMNTVKIDYFKNIKSKNQIVDFTGKSQPDYEINFDENDLADGYLLKFEMDSADSYISDKQKDDLGGYPVVASVDTEDDLNALPGPFSTFDLAYVRNINAYYQYGGRDWFYYSSNFFDKTTKEGTDSPIEISTKVVPTGTGKQVLYITYEDSGSPSGYSFKVGEFLLPCSNIGVSGNKLLMLNHPSVFENEGSDVPLRNEITQIINQEIIKIQPHVNYCYYIQNNLHIAYPYASCTNMAPDGTVLSGENYFWDSPDHNGLYDTHWKPFISMLENAILVPYQILIDNWTDEQRDYELVILMIDGQQYLVKKINIPLPAPSVAKFELVRI